MGRSEEQSQGMESVELTFSDWAFGGEALGRDAQGRVIFAPFTIPGERARVDLSDVHARWARGRAQEWLIEAPQRVAARCLHFGECGGCHYQHVELATQSKAKAEIVRHQLTRIGGFEDPPLAETVPAPQAWNYRNKLSFRQTPEGRLAYTALDGTSLMAVQECHLPMPELGDLWPRLALEPIPGLQEISLRVGRDDARMVIFRAEGPPRSEFTIDAPLSVVWLWPEGTAVLAGDDHLWMEAAGRDFRVSAGSFFQVNNAQAGELVSLVMEALAPQPGEWIFDLYAGVGLFSLFLAEAGAGVVAVEASPWACADFEANLDPYPDVELYEADLETALAAIPQQPSAAVVDPPRAGMSREALQALVARSPERLVYVSC
ncbi:MAG TPA: hypothetical protein VF982_03640, partial [Anaerolineales bacterium]